MVVEKMTQIFTQVRNLVDGIYQVIEITASDQFGSTGDAEIRSETVLFQGSLSDCEAYIRLRDNGYIA